MLYEEFKKKAVNEILSYLPEEYSSHRVKVTEIHKVNKKLESLIIAPEATEHMIPNLYLNELYDYYMGGKSFHETMEHAAEFYLQGISMVKTIAMHNEFRISEDKIVCQLINTEKNQNLINRVPHRSWLDLTIIYRVISPIEEGGFNSTIIYDSLAEKKGWSEEQLYRLSMENTPLLLPLTTDEIQGAFDIISNTDKTLGACAVLFQSVLEYEAEQMDGDFFLIPSSIHEMLVVPAEGHEKEGLQKVLQECNRKVLDEMEILSDSIYFYDRKRGEVSIA